MSKTKQLTAFAAAMLRIAGEVSPKKSTFYKRGVLNEYTIEMRTSGLQLRTHRRERIL